MILTKYKIHTEYFRAGFILFFFSCLVSHPVYSQTEVEPWGNITGIRVDGQLMGFESSIWVVGKDWSAIVYTAKERQRPHYTREGKAQHISTLVDSLSFNEAVEDIGPGAAKVKTSLTAGADRKLAGVFYTILLPGDAYADGSLQLIDPAAIPLNNAADAGVDGPKAVHEYLHALAGGIKFASPHRGLEIRFEEPTMVIATKERDNIRLYIALHDGDLQKEQTAVKTFTISVSGDIDRDPVTLSLNTSPTGRAFVGLGGNFRLQNPKADPQVIDYCLQNLRVAWGRVEMPWRFWQPVMDSDPTDSAKAGKLNPFVQKAMEMAQTLNKKGIPLIISAWSAPPWAVEGTPKFRPGPDGVWGNPLNKEHMNEIYKSITDYLLYLKKAYGVEINLFSFNESDLGINIRVTGKEHDELIKGLGAYFAAHGVKTKMLLGDNSDANSWSFIYPTMEDVAAKPYIGAISFHSWRGWEKETLEKWADAATKMGLPLIVAEGSIDAAAWNYPAIFEEQTYAIKEIDLYTRLLAICQPLSILQWQLTSDYSPLSGGGIFGNNEPLHPTQRFWNLKQLASTPKGLLAMPIVCDRPNISCAALGNNSKGVYSIQLVNSGAARETTLTGLPKKVKSLRITMTNKDQSMKEGETIKVSGGQAKFTLAPMTYTTLSSQ
jgi:hypothetical protein